MEIKITKELQDINLNVIAYEMDVSNNISREVTNLLDETIKNYQNFCELTNVVNDPIIKETRDAYKKLKKDPSHTRPACEALLRRIVSKKGLYRLNDLIDLGNILSIETRRSVCCVDYNKIKDFILIRKGQNESYQGINRGLINANNLIIYTDNSGIFGSPTSDTPRTMIDESTKKIIVMIIVFSDVLKIENEERLLYLYKHFANAQNLSKINVRYI